MTTGRINQVTIVRRGWPPAPVRAPERFPSYWWRHEGAPLTAPSARPTAPRSAVRFPPLSSPGHPSTALNPRGSCGLGAPGGGRSAQLQPLRCPLHEVTSRCSVVDLARGQSPTEPNRRRLEANLSPPAGILSRPARLGGRFREGRRPL